MNTMNERRMTSLFWIHVVLFVLVITGGLPRTIVPIWTSLLIIYAIFAPPAETAAFFIRSVPLFIAIPLSTSFDNFNMWRPFAAVMFLHWAWDRRAFLVGIVRSWHRFPARHPIVSALAVYFLLAILSLLGAPDRVAGAMRIILIANALMVPFVVADSVRSAKMTLKSALRSLFVGACVVITAGFIQLAATYVMDIYQFMRLWGEGIQFRQFGHEWSYIATHVGNTWLAYYGNQLSLRVFSLFTDSHTFPMYVLMAIPAVFALSLGRLSQPENQGRLRSMIRTRSALAILWIPLAYLIIILSGTRGIWAAFVPVAGLAVLGAVWVRKRWNSATANLHSYLSLYLAAFLMLFAVAYPLFISPQFLLSKGDWGQFGNRIRSIVDFGETSNSARIEIWKETVVSVKEHPLLGVGIGNFPTVLKQDISLARAGSSAHNLYLHIAAETGIVSLLVVLWMFWRIWLAAFTAAPFVRDPYERIFAIASLIYLPWVWAYLMTDAALFDERALLQFGIVSACIMSLGTSDKR